MQLYVYTMSVKNLVEFLFQSGDLSSTFFSVERANIGSRIHRKLQAMGGDNYQSEVFLKQETQLDEDIKFIIEGRADGVITLENERICIDEIKTVTCDYEDIHEDLCFTHWAQAYSYAYIYALQNNKDEIRIQLTYYQIDIDQSKHFQRQKTFEELETFYIGMLEEYRVWAMQQRNFQKVRNISIQNLSFPFPTYRPGQRELAIAVYKTILDEDVMFAQAPTGIGKTISTLFPGIKALKEGKIEHIFYLSAKTITARVAQDAIIKMGQAGLRIKCTSINAKDKMCLLEERNCDPEVCPYAKGYYDRLRPTLLTLLQEKDYMDKDVFTTYGKQYQLCPFELSLDVANYSDIIICDYNYVFDPRVYLKRFFSEPGSYLFLVDEAHNLVDRSRSMYSASLMRSQFSSVRKLLPTSEKKLRKVLQEVSNVCKVYGELCVDGFYVEKEPFTDFLKVLNKFQKECDLYLNKEHEESKQVQDLYFEVVAFIRIAEYYDDHFVSYVQEEVQDITIKQFCLDPSRPLYNTLQKGKAAIYFSATLTPIRYFENLLYGKTCEKKIALPSPFDVSRNKLIINNSIDTRYRVRKHSIEPICDMIATTIATKQGNYIVFFPSYAYLKEVATMFCDQYPTIHVELQASNMDEYERHEFLQKFEETKETMVCFCVLGGMFSEGIDLRGDKLIGTIIVGVGLPQINQETNLLRNFFDEEAKVGYAYAYVYPGMNKVLQAAGRVIRSDNDAGVTLLLDSRYTESTYRPLFPAHLRHYEIIQSNAQLKRTLQAFWKEVKQ